jgi:hypothetical protein
MQARTVNLGFTVTETPLVIEPVVADPFCPSADETFVEPGRRHRSASADTADSTALPATVHAT